MSAFRNVMTTQRVSLSVTKACTLKCKLCGALAPYVKKYNPSFNFLKREIDAFFRIVDTTGIVDISGGEPFLRGGKEDGALGEVLRHLCNAHVGRFTRIRIFTNGTVLPDDSLCEFFRDAAAKTAFSVTIDDYGEHSPLVNAIAGKLKLWEIEFEVRDYSRAIHCDGWVDLRDLSKKHEAAGARKLYRKCAIPQKLGCCLEMMDGVITPCSVAASRYLCGAIDRDSDDVLDLFMNPEEARRKLGRIFTTTCFDSCQYCNGGMSDDSQRFVPAEQATHDEIEEWRNNFSMRM